MLEPDAEGDYLTDPPTSGPHYVSAVDGIVSRTLFAAEQVGILETGRILVQYRPADIELNEVAGLAGSGAAVVAPNPNLPSAVVATAWAKKMECGSVDRAELGRFITDEGGGGPAHS